MKNIGKIFICVGLALLVFTIFMDVSVQTQYGERVVNVGLISDRLMLVLIGGFLFLGGVILFTVSRERKSGSESVGENINNQKLKSIEIPNYNFVNILNFNNYKFILEVLKNNIFNKDLFFWGLFHATLILIIITICHELGVNLAGMPREFVAVDYCLATLFLSIYVAILIKENYHMALSFTWYLAALGVFLCGIKFIFNGIYPRPQYYIIPFEIDVVIKISLLYLFFSGVFYILARRYKRIWGGN